MVPPPRIHFSRRGTFPAASEHALRTFELAQCHPRFVDLSVSSPLRTGLVLPNLCHELSHADSNLYRPVPRGDESARSVVLDLLRERRALSLDRILLTASTSEAYSFLFGALCDPGDSVLVPTPSYPLFEQLAHLTDVRLVPYHIRYDGTWHLDSSTLPSARELEEERIRFVLAVSPNNPTGNYLTRRELDLLMNLGVPVVIDEVFRAYPHDSARGIGFDPLSLEAPSVPLLLLDGLSKRLAAPGMKLGWLVAHGPGSEEILEHLDWYADAHLSVGSAVQQALARLLQHESAIQARVHERLAVNLKTVATLSSSSALTFLSAEGGWSKIVRVPAVEGETQTWHRLAQAGVWIQPGHFFDLPFPNSFVASLLTPPDHFAEGLGRMTELFASC